MKKLVYLLFFSLLIFNCSPEENNTDSKDNNTTPPTPTGNELEISHYITTTNLGNTYQYNFENFQQINTINQSWLYL